MSALVGGSRGSLGLIAYCGGSPNGQAVVPPFRIEVSVEHFQEVRLNHTGLESGVWTAQQRQETGQRFTPRIFKKRLPYGLCPCAVASGFCKIGERLGALLGGDGSPVQVFGNRQ